MISWLGLADEVLELAADSAKQFRHATEVPVRVRNPLMAQILCQEEDRLIWKLVLA